MVVLCSLTRWQPYPHPRPITTATIYGDRLAYRRFAARCWLVLSRKEGPNMTTVHTNTISVHTFEPYGLFDQAELAAAAFLARYSGRTLEAYRHDLRTFFQWASTVGLAVLEATRPHIELCRAALEERSLAASTID